MSRIADKGSRTDLPEGRIMAIWLVEVEYTQRKTKTLTVYAPDEEAAGEKVAEIVESWPGVTDAEIIDVEPDE